MTPPGSISHTQYQQQQPKVYVKFVSIAIQPLSRVEQSGCVPGLILLRMPALEAIVIICVVLESHCTSNN